MTREETKKAIEVMQHYVDGGDVEVCNELIKKWSIITNPSWDLFGTKYRIKPKEEKKYWDCPSDVVIGAVYRIKGKIQILYASLFNNKNIGIGNRICNWDNIQEYEYSTDGKTWQECLK